MFFVRCNNEKDHIAHLHTSIQQVSCSGIVGCGEIFHDSHQIVTKVEVWCYGLCNCGLGIDIIHGPGQHK